MRLVGRSLLAFAWLGAGVACGATLAPEVAIIELPLAPEALPGHDDPEFSSLAWYGDRLVLLPQFPERHDHRLPTIERRDVDAFVHGLRETLPVDYLAFDAGDLATYPGYEGFEALDFVDDEAYLTAEFGGTTVAGYVLRGAVNETGTLVFDPKSAQPLPHQSTVPNMGYEALVAEPSRVILFYELYDRHNSRREALVFSRQLEPLPAIPMAGLEYRITDATTKPGSSDFWVSNYHWPGTPFTPASCTLTARHGQGETHARSAAVERIVALNSRGPSIGPAPRPPLLLALGGTESRNWEGIAALPGYGFVVVTDKHPRTILAVVHAP
ncbi:MAG: hypothetical protein KC416_12570 [Myxococcales bacterium]|nr:hypothetical protein [Myxococcales bacterium]